MRIFGDNTEQHLTEDQWKMLESLGITRDTNIVMATAILAQKVLDLEKKLDDRQ